MFALTLFTKNIFKIILLFLQLFQVIMQFFLKFDNFVILGLFRVLKNIF